MDYKSWTEIHRGRRHVVLEGVDPDGTHRIAKTVTNPYPTAADVNAIVREHGVLESLAHIGGVARVARLERRGEAPVLVLERAGHGPLSAEIDGPLSVDRFLQIAVPLAETLAGVHDEGVIHRDITPANIIIDSRPVLIDFGLATRLVGLRSKPLPVGRMVGNLAYVAPEQTGRVGIGVDTRADLYSLGLVFYEMLSGRRAFDSQDPATLVHSQIARLPPPLGGVPEYLVRLVDALIAKEPLDRYQSAWALHADLAAIADAHGSASEPKLAGRSQQPGRLLVPQHVHGHEHIVGALAGAIEAAAHGRGGAALLLEGPPGSGKTTIVARTRSAVVGAGGLFARGRFAAGDPDMPYHGVRRALNEVIDGLTTLPDAEQDAWRARFAERLGGFRRPVFWLLPRLAAFFGENRPRRPAESDPTAARNRVFSGVLAMLEALASEGPFVLALDDFHRADESSIALCEYLAERVGSLPIVLIASGAPGPAFGEFAREWKRIAVSPIGREDIEKLCAEVLGTVPERVESLAGHVFDRSGGNPLFAIEYIRMLHREGHLVAAPHGWAWDLDAIAAATLPEDAANLLIHVFDDLPEATQGALARAAVIGQRFLLESLSWLIDRPMADLLETLWPAIERGLIWPAGDGWETPRGSAVSEEDLARGRPTFAFVHDRVHAAANERLSPD